MMSVRKGVPCLPLDWGSDSVATSLHWLLQGCRMRAQGEFVNGTRLEADYAGTSSCIHQMYIYANSLRAYILAVVVPSRGAGPATPRGIFETSHCVIFSMSAW